MRLYLDSTLVGTYSPTSANNGNWIQLSMAGLVVPATTNSLHTIRLEVSTQGQGSGNTNIFAVDDFSITATAAPTGGPALCAS
jgi:hypothetical protein